MHTGLGEFWEQFQGCIVKIDGIPCKIVISENKDTGYYGGVWHFHGHAEPTAAGKKLPQYIETKRKLHDDWSFGLEGDAGEEALAQLAKKGAKMKKNPALVTRAAKGGPKTKTVKNLGWLLKNWKSVVRFRVVAARQDAKGRGDDAVLSAKMRDGSWYVTPYASREVLQNFLNRPVFITVPVSWFGVNMVIGKDSTYKPTNLPALADPWKAKKNPLLGYILNVFRPDGESALKVPGLYPTLAAAKKDIANLPYMPGYTLQLFGPSGKLLESRTCTIFGWKKTNPSSGAKQRARGTRKEFSDDSLVGMGDRGLTNAKYARGRIEHYLAAERYNRPHSANLKPTDILIREHKKSHKQSLVNAKLAREWGIGKLPNPASEKLSGYTEFERDTIGAVGELLDGQGKVLGSAEIVAKWKAPNSFVSSHYFQIEVTTPNGVVYTGRGAGSAMVWFGKLKKG